jgi:hypothetical protein
MNRPEWNERIVKLAKKVRGISRPIIFNKVAVIVEPRILPIVEHLLKWMSYLLVPHGWKFIFYTGTLNNALIHDLVNKLSIVDIVEVRQLETENLTLKDYNVLLTSKKFWQDIPFENILIFQTDTVLLDGNLDKFLEYDYVGAPWKNTFTWLNSDKDITGNGGLSLRKKSGMLRALEAIPYNNLNEDTYFSIKCKNLLNIAPVDLAMQFSVESVFYNNPKGYHKCWNYISKSEMDSVYKNIDDIISSDLPDIKL